MAFVVIASAFVTEGSWLQDRTRGNAMPLLGIVWLSILGSVSFRRAVSTSLFFASVLPMITGLVAHMLGDVWHMFVSDAAVTIVHTLLIVLFGWLIR